MSAATAASASLVTLMLLSLCNPTVSAQNVQFTYSSGTSFAVNTGGTSVNGFAVYFNGGDNNTYAVNTTSGTLLWKTKIAGQTSTRPRILNLAVYVSSWVENAVYGLNAKTGAIIWKKFTKGQPHTPDTDGVNVYVSCYNGWVHAFDCGTGAEVYWSPKFYNSSALFTPPIFASFQIPSVYAGTLYLTEAFGTAYAINTATGATIWQVSAPRNNLLATAPVYGNGYIYSAMNGNDIVTGKPACQLVAFNAATGAYAWEASDTLTGQCGGYTQYRNGMVYVATGMTILAYQALGQILPVWTYTTANSITSGIITYALADKTVLISVGSTDSNVYLLNGATGNLIFKVKTSAAIGADCDIDASGVVYAPATDGTLWAIATNSNAPTSNAGTTKGRMTIGFPAIPGNPNPGSAALQPAVQSDLSQLFGQTVSLTEMALSDLGNGPFTVSFNLPVPYTPTIRANFQTIYKQISADPVSSWPNLATAIGYGVVLPTAGPYVSELIGDILGAATTSLYAAALTTLLVLLYIVA